LFFRPEDFDIYSGAGTGYPLFRNKLDLYEIDIDPNANVGADVTLAWSVLDLFNQKGELQTGSFKVPIYLPPADTNIDLHRFHELVTRVQHSRMYMRIEHAYFTDSSMYKEG